MCDSIAEGGVRCPHDAALYNQNRIRARVQRRAVADVFREIDNPEAASVVMKMRPSDLLMLNTRLEDINPDLAADIRGAVGGRFPGSHNAILLENRATGATKDIKFPVKADTHVLKDGSTEIKEDPRRVSTLQGKLLDVETSLLEHGLVGDGVSKRDLEESVRVRRRALEAGYFSTNRDENSQEAIDNFLAHSDLNTLHHLSDVERGISQRMFNHAFHHADIDARQRTATPFGRLNHDLTLKDALKKAESEGLKEVEIADGVMLSRGKDGEPYLTVDPGSGRTVTLASPVMGYERLDQITPRIPKVHKVEFHPQSEAPDSQASVYEAAMTANTREGRYNQDNLARAITASVFNSDKAPGRYAAKKAVSNPFDDSIKMVRREYNRAGKSPSVTLAALTSSGHRTSDPAYARTGGLRDSTVYRRAAKAYGEKIYALVPDALRDTKTVTPRGNKRTWKDGRYTGKDDQAALGRKVGFQHKVLRGADTTVEERPTIAKLRPVEHGQSFSNSSTKGFSDLDWANTVRRANRISRTGSNPETCGTEAVKAHAIMERLITQHDATLRVNPQHAATSVSTHSENIPDDVDISSLFARGSTVRTKGHTLAATSTATKDVPPKAKGTRRVNYVYASGDAVPVSTGRVIIPDNSAFTVSKTVEAKDGSLTVELVSVDSLADGHDPRDKSK